MSIFSKFLSKHSKELSTIGDALSVIAQVVPLGHADRDVIVTAVNSVNNAADAIAKSIDDVKDVTEIKPSKSEIENAVREHLPTILAAVLTELLTPKEPTVTSPAPAVAATPAKAKAK